jgi:hypothetical protein
MRAAASFEASCNRTMWKEVEAAAIQRFLYSYFLLDRVGTNGQIIWYRQQHAGSQARKRTTVNERDNDVSLRDSHSHKQKQIDAASKNHAGKERRFVTLRDHVAYITINAPLPPICIAIGGLMIVNNLGNCLHVGTIYCGSFHCRAIVFLPASSHSLPLACLPACLPASCPLIGKQSGTNTKNFRLRCRQRAASWVRWG